MPGTDDQLRIKWTRAARRLDISTRTLFKLAVEDEEFTVIVDDPASERPRRFLLTAEVDAFGLGGLTALREYRAKRRRKVGAR